MNFFLCSDCSIYEFLRCYYFEVLDADCGVLYDYEQDYPGVK